MFHSNKSLIKKCVRSSFFFLLATGNWQLVTIASAHGGVDDGHVDASGHALGASALLKAFSPQWWALLLVALLITSALSYFMWRFLQVPKKPNS